MRTTPPLSLLAAEDLATHTVDLTTWSLQSFWRRFFSVVKTHRTSWWERILKIAVAYDMYTQKTTISSIHHNPLSLTMQCQSTKSIFDCICLLHNILTKPEMDSLFTPQQRRNMLLKTQLLYGKLELYEEMAERLREATPSSLRSKIRRIFSSSSSPVSPTHHRSTSIQIPALPALVSDNEMLQGDDGRYQPYQTPIQMDTRVFTVDDEGFIIDPVPPRPSMSPPQQARPSMSTPRPVIVRDDQSSRQRPRLQQQKSFWRQFHKE